MAAVLSAGASVSSGQVEVCDPLDCKKVSTLPQFKSWVPGSPSYTADRRPVIFVQFVGFNFCANFRGLAPWWYEDDDDPMHTMGNDVDPDDGIPDTFNHLLTLLDQYAADGWKRIIFEFPAGSVKSNVNISSAHWWTMPAWKRAAFEEYIADWIKKHPDINVGLYMNFTINRSCTLCQTTNAYDEYYIEETMEKNCPLCYWYPCDAYGDSHPPDAHDEDDTCIFYNNVQPWIDIGIKELWLEAGLGYPSYYWEFAYNPDYSALKIGGEAILPDGNGDPDADALALTAQFATSAFLDIVDPMGEWEIPAGAEAGFGVYEVFTIDQLAEKIGRGYNIWLFNEGTNNIESEKVKRLYSAGPIHIADFNGDLTVNTADYYDFLDAHGGSHPGGRTYNFYHGDVDGSGVVNSSDYYTFIAAFFDSDPYSIVEDFGDPNPESAHPVP